MTREEINAYYRNYRKLNKKKVKAIKTRYNLANKEKLAEYQANYRLLNESELKEYDKTRNLNSDRLKSKKEYSKSDKGKEQRRKTRKLTINDKWRNMLNTCLSRLGKHKEGKSIDLLGYSASDLYYHMIPLFAEGMSWDNHGEWHIDHIVPVSSFDKNTPPMVVNALSNLQPLWAVENIKKSNKLIS